MCSVNPDLEDDDTNILMPVEAPVKPSLLCRKCKEVSPVVVLQGKFPYCKTCFSEVVSHKFFGCLGKSKSMKHSDRVLILCSGSQSSAVLLNLIKIGLTERQKKILSEAFVLFIDCGAFFPLSVNERMDLVKQIKEMVSFFGFKSYYSSLGNSKDSMKEMSDISWCSPEFLDRTSYKQYVESLSTSSAKEDLLVKIRMSVAVSIARQLGCNKIFSAETNDHTAAKILSNIALGRGDQLPLDIGFLDNRFEGVQVLRPLRECSRKEIAFYRLIYELPFVTYRKGETMKGKDNSIQKLTEKFVAELQVSFPSTVSMVIGTGNKLALKQGTQQHEDICALCKGNLRISDERELSSVSATRVSHLISTQGTQGFNTADFTKNSQADMSSGEPCNKECCYSKNKSAKLDNIIDAFCYGCQLILKDMGSVDGLPVEVLKDAEHKIKLKEMRKEIDHFLI